MLLNTSYSLTYLHASTSPCGLMWLTRHERELRRGSDASELRWVCAVTDEGNEDDAGVTTETQ